MRERLLIAFASFAVVTVLLYAVPRGFILADQARRQEREDASRLAEMLEAFVEGEIEAGRTLSAGEIDGFIGPGDSVRLAGGTLDAPIVVGGSDAGGAFLVRRSLDGGGVLEVRRSHEVVDERVVESVTPIVVIGAVVVGVALAGAWLLARRVSRPFRELADAAASLGEGEFDLELPATTMREAASIANALHMTAQRLAETLRRERQFASNASHQLRTPLTALRLRMEDVSLWPDVPPEIRTELVASLGEVHRLADTVDGLLAFSRLGSYGPGDLVELSEVVGEVAERWRRLAPDSERSLRVEIHAAMVFVPVDAVRHVLDVLVENAIKHGAGEITIETITDGENVRVRVRDEGPAIAPTDRDRIFVRHYRSSAAPGQGIGLSLARELAESLGGRLEVAVAETAAFDFILPTRR